MDLLFWTPFGDLHRLLLRGEPGVTTALDAQFKWLVDNLSSGACGFKPPSDASKKLLETSSVIPLTSGQKFAVDAKLRKATLQASIMLELDELQTHILVKRWVRDQGLRAAVKAAEQDYPFDGHAMLQVLASYHQERLLLLKSLQTVIVQGLHDAAMKQFTGRLLEAGLEHRLAAALRSNVEATAQPAVLAPGQAAAGTIAQRMSAVIKHLPSLAQDMVWLSSLHATSRDQVLAERCELLALLTILYELAGVRCSSSRVLELCSLMHTALLPPGGRGRGGQAAALPSSGLALVAEHLACVLVLASLALPEYVSLVQRGGDSASPAPHLSADQLPLGGKVHDVHRVLSDWGGGAASVGLLITWSGLVRLIEPWLDLGEPAVARLQAAAQAAGGFQAAAQVLEAVSQLSSSTTQQLARGVLLKALCVMAAAFDLGPSRQDAAGLAALLDYVKQVLAGDPHACRNVWDSSLALTLPLREVVRDAAALFPAVPQPYLQLLAMTGHGPTAASAAYQHLQSLPHLVCLHQASEASVRSEGGSSVRLVHSVTWNKASSVHTMTLPEGIPGKVLPLPAVLSGLDPRQWALVCWDVGGTHHSFGQLLLLGRVVHGLHCLQLSLSQALPVDAALLQELQDILTLTSTLVAAQPDLVPDLLTIAVDPAGPPPEPSPPPPSPTPSAGSAPGVVRAGSSPKRTWLFAAAEWVSLTTLLASSYCHKEAGEGGVGDLGSGGGGGALSSRAGGAAASASARDVVVRRLLDSAAQGLVLLEALSQQQPGAVVEAVERLHLMAGQGTEAMGVGGVVLASRVALAQLPEVDAPASLGLALGQLPALADFQRLVEGGVRHYPVTRALLSLSTSLLARGYNQGWLAVHVVYAAQQLLPLHPQWPYQQASQRWELGAALMDLMRAAVESGALQGGAGPAATPLPSGLAVGPRGGGLPGEGVVCVSGLGAWLLHQLLFNGAALLAPCLPPEPSLLEGARAQDSAGAELLACEGCVAGLLQLLCLVLHAAMPFAGCLPLETFLFNQGALTSRPAPAALLLAYVAYSQPGDEVEEGQRLSCLALRFMLALQASAARAAAGGGAQLPLRALLAPDALTETALRQAFRPEVCAQQPLHFVLAAEVVATAAACGDAELLDCLLFPCALRSSANTGGTSSQGQGPGAAAEAPLLLPAGAGAGAGAGVGAGAGAGAGADGGQKGRGGVPGAKKEFSALDGLMAALAAGGGAGGPGSSAQASIDGSSGGSRGSAPSPPPEVLAAAWRLAHSLWSAPQLGLSAVTLLRAQPAFWAALEQCLAPPPASPPASPPLPSAAPGPAAGAEAGGADGLPGAAPYAWQLLLLEVHSCPRGAGGRGGAGGGEGGGSTALWALVDRLAARGVLQEAACRPLLLSTWLPAVRQLQHTLHALYLELAACALASCPDDPGSSSSSSSHSSSRQVGGPAAHSPISQLSTKAVEGLLPVAAELDQELSGLWALLREGRCSTRDVEEVHSWLYSRATRHAACLLPQAPAASPPPGSDLSPGSSRGAGGLDGTPSPLSLGGFTAARGTTPRFPRDSNMRGGVGEEGEGGEGQWGPWGQGAEGEGLAVVGRSGVQAVLAWLSLQPLGQAILSRSLNPLLPSPGSAAPPTLTGGSAAEQLGLCLASDLGLGWQQPFLTTSSSTSPFDPARLGAALGPVTQSLAAADLLAAALLEVNAAMLASAQQLGVQQSAAALLLVLLRERSTSQAAEGQSAARAAPLLFLEAGPGGGGGGGAGALRHSPGLQAAALQAAVDALSSLAAWATKPEAALMTQPWAGLGRLGRQLQSSALAAARLLLGCQAALTSSRPAEDGAGQAAAFSYAVPATPSLFTPQPPTSSAAGGGGVRGGRSADEPAGQGLRGAERNAAGGAARCVQLASVVGPWLRLADSGRLSSLDQGLAAALQDALLAVLLAGLLQLPPGSSPGAGGGAGGGAGAREGLGGPDVAEGGLFGGLGGGAAARGGGMGVGQGAGQGAGQGPRGDGELQALHCLLLDMLPMLCKSCGGRHRGSAVGVQLVQLVVSQHLPPEDWLPVLQQHLDFAGLVQQAVDNTQTAPKALLQQELGSQPQNMVLSESSDLGVLQLALSLAQSLAGARWLLLDCGVMERLSSLAQGLLGPSGGGLAAWGSLNMGPGFDRLSKQGWPGPGAGAGGGDRGQPLLVRPLTQGDLEEGVAGSLLSGLDTAGAYVSLPGGAGVAWSPVHRQWCTLLGFAGSLLRTLGGYLDVQEAAVTFLSRVESRLLLALLPPASDARQPLSMSGLVELQRALYLATHCAKHAGMWHLLLPGSLPKFRCAATAFLAFASGGSSSRPVTLECPPLSREEVSMAACPAGLPTPAWFRVCALGASNPGALAPPSQLQDLLPPRSPAPAPAAAGQSAPAPALLNLGGYSPTASLSYSGDPAGLPGSPAYFTALQGQGGDGGGQLGGSQYSAALAEAMYSAVHHALVFLLCSSPQVNDGEGEGGALGPMWPRARDLLALQDQALLVLHAMADAPRPLEGRRKNVVGLMTRILHLLFDMLDGVGVPQSKRALAARQREQVAAIERALAAGARLPQITPGLISHASVAGKTPSLSASLSITASMAFA